MTTLRLVLLALVLLPAFPGCSSRPEAGGEEPAAHGDEAPPGEAASQETFSDDFESGDTRAWSETPDEEAGEGQEEAEDEGGTRP